MEKAKTPTKGKRGARGDTEKAKSPVKTEEPKVEAVAAAEAEPSSASKKRKQRSTSEVEPRTPLKRQRVPVQKFQSPAEELIPVPSTSKQGKDAPELLHKKGSFLGVRGEEGSFYLCKTIQNVFENTRKFRIQWLDLGQPPDVYKLDFVDTTDADCILTNVKMEKVVKDTYRLPMKEQRRVEEILHKALKKERGEPVDDIIIHMSDVDEDEDEVESDEEDWEDTPKKPKRQSKGKKVETPKGKGAKGKPSKAEKDKKETKEKPSKKRGSDKQLHPNPKIKILEKDPFFETKEKVEFISKTAHGKLAIRAVLLGDMKMLKSLIEDKEHVYLLKGERSVDINRTALHYAVEKQNHEAIRLLMKDYFDKNERVEKGTGQSVLIQQSDSGQFNPMSLGRKFGSRAFIRPLSQSRGSKQGNDAFVKDRDTSVEVVDFIEEAMKLGVSNETLDLIIQISNKKLDASCYELEHAFSNVYQAVLCGNRKLAGYLVDKALKDSSTGFGFLHRDVLLFDKEDLRPTIMAASVKKKPWDNKSITPLHCAAINPNTAYLQRLLSIEPNINIEDRDHRRPIHFAAVCDGVGPLEFLLQRGASPLEQDNSGMIPLHYACSAGRPRNVDILVKKAMEAASNQGDAFATKWGPGGVDKPSRLSFCPVHVAVGHNHADVLKILIKHQVDINKVLSAGKNKITPLMIAAQQGNLEICKVLVQAGAEVEKLDKLKRSALIHAVINGHTHVASYLLNLGSNPDRCDSSGNSVVHYAAAYGWMFCLKLLQEVDADLGVSNEWGTTPICIAFLKGHVGIVDYLLKQPGVDINFKNESGLTLTSIAVKCALESSLYDQMKSLIDKKSNPTIRDGNGYDSLHHLASNKIFKPRQHYWGGREEPEQIDEDKMEVTVKIARLLLDAGCDPTAETDDGTTALMFAIENLNIKLVELLVEHGATVTSHKSEDGKSILHMMSDLCMQSDLGPILKILVEQKPKVKVKPKEAVVQEPKKENEKQEKMVVENGDNGSDTGSKAEAMDVDGEAGGEGKKADSTEKKAETKPTENGDGAGVNGMEVDEAAPPALEKQKSIASQEDIWPLMAGERDNAGYTPLLAACKVYREFKKGARMSEEDVKRYSEYGRSFMTALIELAGADVSATVGEKTFTDNEMPTTEEEKYGKDGKSSALHMLVHVGHEVLDGQRCAGLRVLCQHAPNTEHRDKDGRTPLILAVTDKSLVAVNLLIEAGANVNMTYGTEATGLFTPLHKAAEDGNVEIVKALIKAGANTKAANTKTEDQPLHLAVHFRGDDHHVIEVVQALLDGDADVNAGKFTPLHAAVLANTGKSDASTELEEFLIARGANVFARDEKQKLPLHLAFVSQANPKSTSQVDPIELVSVLTDSMSDRELNAQDVDGRTPLHMAARRGATICSMHLRKRGVNLHTTTKVGHTPLSLAVKNAHDSCAIVFLKEGSKVDSRIVLPPPEKADWRKYYSSKEGKQKLPIWSWIPTRDILPIQEEEVFDIYETALKLELQGVAHMVLDSTGLTGRAIEAALRVNKYHVALRHLHRVKDNTTVAKYTNTDGQNLLHVLALVTKATGNNKALQLKVAKALLEKGVSLKNQDNYSRYPIVYVALQYQPLELAQFFLENGTVDLNAADKFGHTVMDALFVGQEQLQDREKKVITDYIKLFVDKGASLDSYFPVSWPSTPMFDVSIAGSFVDYFKPMDAYGCMTPLIASIYHDDKDLVRYLLKNKANVNTPDKNGVTPLMHAVKQNDAYLVRLLLNFDYEKKDSKEDVSRPVLKKKLSRKVFAATALGGDDDEEEDDDFDKKRGGGGGGGSDDDDGGGSDEDVENDENEDPMSDGGDDFEDSDHDTDVVDEDDEDEDSAAHLPLPKLGSKQPSLRKQPTSLASKDEFEVVEKTSPVDLKAKDNKGWTVMHHLVCPLEYGTYDNEEIFYVLKRAGADTTAENGCGDTPLKMALRFFAVKLAARLQAGVEEEKKEKPVFVRFNSDAPSTAPKRAFVEDAESMMKKLLPSEPAPDSKPSSKVDSKCMAAGFGGEVVIDKSQDMAYDVILSKIEVRSMLGDHYNFYKMQIVYHKAKGIYILFTKWGRIGDEGMYQQTPYQTLSEAAVSFAKIFRSKTGNLWSNVKKFVVQPKKYRLVELDSQPQPVVRVDFKMDSGVPSSLGAELQNLLTEMADVGMMKAAMSNAKMAEEYMPFGRIKKERLIEARKLLQTIGDAVVEMEKKRQNPTYDNTEHQKTCQKISGLSTEYYSLIPVEGYAYERIEPLTSLHLVKTHLRLITNLLDLETASRMLLGAQFRASEVNPLDYIYRELGCTISPLREDDTESQYILKYIHSSVKKTQVLCIYRLCRPGEDEQEKFKSLERHRLLWHGTSMSNLMGILANGLLVAPPEAPITGHAFGEGIYTADSFEKSQGYCYNYNPNSSVKCALLTEVALGNLMEQTDNTDLDMIHSEYNSLLINGRSVPDPDWNVSLPYGASIPIGCSTTREHWINQEGEKIRPLVGHNEYIVQDSDQIALRYLVLFV